MNTGFRIALGLLCLALAGAPAPASGDPFTDTIPNHILVVARGPNGADTAMGRATVVIRDLAANPVPGVTVTIDFSACPDVAISQDQLDARYTVDCGLLTVTAVTDADGRADFTVLGTTRLVAPAGHACARIYANGILEAAVPVAVLDRDGTGGLTPADLSIWSADYFSATDPDRANLDAIAGVDLKDLAVWADAYFGGNDTASAGPYCP